MRRSVALSFVRPLAKAAAGLAAEREGEERRWDSESRRRSSRSCFRSEGASSGSEEASCVAGASAAGFGFEV